MLSAHGIVNQNVSRVPGMQNMLGSTELPETGAFDFFNYLLGLQVSSGDSSLGQDALFPVLGKESESIDQKDPLQTLFQKKEQPLWNPLVPVGNPVIQNQPLLNLKNSGGDSVMNNDGNEKLAVLSESSGNDKTTQDKQLLENRLLEPALFLHTKAKEIGVNSANDLQDTDKSEGASSMETSVADSQKSKGIGKYTELSQLRTQQAKDNERTNSSQMIGEKDVNSGIRPEVNTQAMGELKSSEKKRGEDQDSSFVVLNSAVHTQHVSNGNPVNVEKPQVMEKASLPEVFKKVETMIHHGGGKMTVELSPPELGKLEVDVVTKGNQVEIKMRSDNDVAKVTLESHMSELKNAMEGQNLTLHKVEVQVGLGHGHSFQEGRHTAFTGSGQGGSERQPSQQSYRSPVPSFTPEVNVRPVSYTSGVKHKGGVDLRI